MVQAVHELQAAGVEPDVWKVEGMDRREDCVNLVAAARRDGRGKSCASPWVAGRTCARCARGSRPPPACLGSLASPWGARRSGMRWSSGRPRRITRDAAVQAIAERYRQWVDIFEEGMRAAAQSERLLRRALNRWENEGGHV